MTGFAGGAELHRLSDRTFTSLAAKPDFLARKGEAVKKVGALEMGAYEVVRIRA